MTILFGDQETGELSEFNSNKYKHALVTGGAGFIGSNLIDKLLLRGMRVTCIDNYLSGNRNNLNDARLSPLFDERVMDVRDIIAKDLEGIDVIFHQAASKKTVCLIKPLKDLDINAGGTLNLALCAKEAGIKKFIHASTGSVYGNLIQDLQDETHPTNPVSYYGISKLAGESYIRLVNPDAVIMRYFHVYGPRQDYSERGGVVAIFIAQMLKGLPPIVFGDGRQERSFTYVDDVVDANLFFMDNNYSGTFNIASGAHINILELIYQLNDIMHSELVPQFAPETIGDIKYFNVSNDKIIRYGFGFHTIFREGLRNTVNYIFKYCL